MTKDKISIGAMCKELNISKSIIDEKVLDGIIISEEYGFISRDDYLKIKDQKEKYIYLEDFLKELKGERYRPNDYKDREKVKSFLNHNEYFGVKLFYEDFLFCKNDPGVPVILREDIGFLAEKCKDVLADIGFNEQEKTARILKSKGWSERNRALIKEFIEKEKNDIKYTDTFTDFVRVVWSSPDILDNTNKENLESMLENCSSETSKDYLRRFLSYLSRRYLHNKITIEKNYNKRRGKKAYNPDQYFKVAYCIFNTDFAKERNVVEKAFEEHIYAEAWLFLSVLFVVGWRPADICNAWKYIYITDTHNPFNINIKTLKDDIINDKIPDEKYASIVEYVVKKICNDGSYPSKIARFSPPTLRAAINPRFYKHYGRLILIAEYHHFYSGGVYGYMNAGRKREYTKWVRLCNLWGEDFLEINGKRNLLPERLIKNYEQRLEQKARQKGYTNLEAYNIASYARNHKNMNTISIYLRDQNYTGFTPEVVFGMMIDRGVWGAYNYKVLLDAFPEEFGKLSEQEKTEMMQLMDKNVSTLQIESDMRVELKKMELSAGFEKICLFGDERKEGLAEILRGFIAICDGCGHCKDKGVYCRLRALGRACVEPNAESGIERICQYMVFTDEAVPSITNVLKKYYNAYRAGDKRCGAILIRRLLPAYLDVIKIITNNMNDNDARLIEEIMKGAING